jgi:dTDP-glucose 4,6-dehydratase
VETKKYHSIGARMRFLITGGLGFQGSNLSRLLLDVGHEVVVLNTFSEKSLNNIELFGLQSVTKVWGSITDKNLVDKTVRDVDCVVHAGANVQVEDSIANPTKYYETNILGTNNILESARVRNIPVLHISSCEVYGNQPGELTEISPFFPGSPYASSKAGADSMCYAYYKTYNMNICIVRPFNVFGPGQRSGKRGAVIPRWVDMAMKGENLTLYGDGLQMREFVYVDDLVKAYALLINHLINGRTLAGQIFNIGSGRETSMVSLAKLILSATQSVSKVVHLPARPGEVMRFVSNSNKFANFSGASINTTIEDGLNKFVGWIKQNLKGFVGE